MNSSVPVKFESSGVFTADEDWIHHSRMLESFEIILVLEGTLYLKQNDEYFTLGKNDVMLLLPSVEHCGFKKVKKGTSFYWAHFMPRKDYQYVTSVSNIEQEFSSDNLYLPIHFSKANAERIIILFNQLCHINETHYTNTFATDYVMTSLLVEISEQFLRTTQISARSSRMEKMMEWIRVNVNRNISLTDVASEFHYSREYISRRFHKVNGITMQKYINKLKISKAKELLVQGDYQIKEITELVGIFDEKYFLRLFKEFEHMSPSQFRNAYSKTHFNKK
jgi:AraC-like DNA-binding protein